MRRINMKAPYEKPLSRECIATAYLFMAHFNSLKKKGGNTDIDKGSLLSWCFCIKEYYCICKYFEQLKQEVQVFPLEVYMFPGVKRLAPGL